MNKTLDEMKMIHEEEMQSYGRIQDRVISVMLSHGCKIVQTPSFEDYDSYGAYFPSLRKEMIKTIDSDGSVLVLRPDVTLPLVKAAAIEFPDGSELLKYGYVTTVFRNYYGMTSHGRDFLQAGVEVLGDPTPECDGEVIVTAAEFLESVGIESMRIDLGTVAYMDALFEALELSERQADELRSCMEKRNLVSFREIAESLPLSGKRRTALLELPSLFGPYGPTMSRARSLCLNGQMDQALDRISRVYEYLASAGYEKLAHQDFGFASHMGYYSDLVFRIYVDDALYSLVSGGRYDKLSEQFGPARPACGFGMNMNLLYEYMTDSGLLDEEGPSFQLAVSYDRFSKNLAADLTRWRKKGYRVMGYRLGNTVDPSDYAAMAVYRDGSYETGGEILSPDEMEKKLEAMKSCCT